MAVTNETSPQYAAQTTAGQTLDSPDQGRVRATSFEFTQGAAAGDIGSTQTLIRLPAGKIRVLTAQSEVTCSAFGASRTLDVGFEAYKEPTAGSGVLSDVAADADYFASAVDVSAAATFSLNESATPARSQVLNSADGIVVKATVAGGTIPAGATLKGYIMWVRA